MGNLPWKLLVFIFGLSKGDWLADEIAKNQLSKAENLKTQVKRIQCRYHHLYKIYYSCT